MGMIRFDVTIKMTGKPDDLAITRTIMFDPGNIYDAGPAPIIRAMGRDISGVPTVCGENDRSNDARYA